MPGRNLFIMGLFAAILAGPSAALAGPAHVLDSRVLEPGASQAVYAVAPSLDEATRKALGDALTDAGLTVVPADQAHTHLVTVRAGSGTLCTASCSSLVFHDDAPLDDYYRHVAVVAAQRTSGVTAAPERQVSWYVVLQKDGLSRRKDAFLPALLRYGAKAYGREVAAERPEKLQPGLRIRPPQLTVSPGL